MKLYLFIIAYFIAFNYSLSQHVSKDSIIVLEQILITNTKKSKKHKIIKTKDKNSITFGLKQTSSFVSLIDHLPSGYIQSIQFYSKSKKNNSDDTLTFRLQVFSVKDNMPAINLLKHDIRFKVNGLKEIIHIDVSHLDIKTETSLFIGLELMDYIKEIDYSIACKVNESHLSFVKIPTYNKWIEVPNMSIKTQLLIKE